MMGIDMGHERLTADELHGEIRLRPETGIGGASFIDLCDTGVLQASESLGFMFKPPQSFRGAKPRLDHFESDAAARLFLLGFIHAAHATFTKQANNPIPADSGRK